MQRRALILMIMLALPLCGLARWRQIPSASTPAMTQPSSTQASTQPATRPAPSTEKIMIGGEEFALEIAADDASRQKGLMGRDHIKLSGGMIFIWPRAERQDFWMKNCVIDIEAIFLDARGQIVALHKMKAEPPRRENETEEDYEDRLKRYSSGRPAQFAIEVKPGTIERLALKSGQTLKADWRRLEQNCQKPTPSPEPGDSNQNP